MHLAKPIDPAELIAAVQALARRRTPPHGGDGNGGGNQGHI